MILATAGKVLGKVFGALPLADWLFLGAVGLGFTWHLWDKHEAVQAQADSDKADIAAANAKAEAEHKAKQALLDGQATQQNAAIDAKVDAISRSTNAIAAKLDELTPTKYAKALPANCLFDDERVRDANEALQR